jgi:hypothetical protein
MINKLFKTLLQSIANSSNHHITSSSPSSSQLLFHLLVPWFSKKTLIPFNLWSSFRSYKVFRVGFWIGLQCTCRFFWNLCWYEEEMNVSSQIVVRGSIFFYFRIGSSYCSTLMLNLALSWNTYSCMSCGKLILVQIRFFAICVVAQNFLHHYNRNHGWVRCGTATFCKVCIFHFFFKSLR